MAHDSDSSFLILELYVQGLCSRVLVFRDVVALVFESSSEVRAHKGSGCLGCGIALAT